MTGRHHDAGSVAHQEVFGLLHDRIELPFGSARVDAQASESLDMLVAQRSDL